MPSVHDAAVAQWHQAGEAALADTSGARISASLSHSCVSLSPALRRARHRPAGRRRAPAAGRRAPAAACCAAQHRSHRRAAAAPRHRPQRAAVAPDQRAPPPCTPGLRRCWLPCNVELAARAGRSSQRRAKEARKKKEEKKRKKEKRKKKGKKKKEEEKRGKSWKFWNFVGFIVNLSKANSWWCNLTSRLVPGFIVGKGSF
ncbi:uncharacterized protein LOC133897021 [Phragmites australis]|uniref:uncharacterized protein LOC133897021 n=1 Tax=Phragmites australis TaxID=29695 RepID=UPI002D7852F4|nr:uncharacterized protein LOC133897021 [Phragmites australis]